MYSHLVLSGGGMKGISFVSALDTLNVDVSSMQSISGTSIGSIIGLLLVIGYTPAELIRVLKETDFKSLHDISYKNFMKDYGLDTGKNLMLWLIRLLEPKIKSVSYDYRQVTFEQLHARYAVQFNVTGVQLNTHTLVYFNYKTSPDMRVLDAIRISVSFPFIFTKCAYKGDVYTDGGVLDNFPVDAVDTPGNILGLRITPDAINFEPDNVSLDTYTTEIINCLLIQIYKLEKMKRMSSCVSVMDINTSVSICVDHNITEEAILTILQDGVKAANRFLLNSAIAQRKLE